MFGMPEAIVAASVILAAAMVLSAWLISRRPRTTSQAAVQSPMLPSLPFAPLPPLPPEAFPVEPSGITVEPDTRLEVGSTVLADWGGAWWKAQVVSLKRDGSVRIHYLGWDSSWDATVSREHLQMDISSSMDS